MIIIENNLVSEELLEEQFVCDLNACKGGCCEDGDAGAPLDENEKIALQNDYAIIESYLTEEGKAVIEQQGLFEFNEDFGWVTPTIKGKMCAYGYRNELGVITCGIEQAYRDGKINWKKPISCHLFPVKVSKSEYDSDKQYVNYEPREDLCKAACSLGKKLKVPVYQFLQEALVRKFGSEFYEALEATANFQKNPS